MLSRSAQERLIEYANAHPSQEVCGFVLSDGSFRPVKNVAADPLREFAFDHRGQMSVVLRANAEGKEILGVFHSHPGGTEEVSSTDLKGWPKLVDGSYCRYWIVANGKVLEFEVQNDRPTLII